MYKFIVWSMTLHRICGLIFNLIACLNIDFNLKIQVTLLISSCFHFIWIRYIYAFYYLSDSCLIRHRGIWHGCV